MLKNVVFSAIDSVEFGDHRGKYSDMSEFFEFVRPEGCVTCTWASRGEAWKSLLYSTYVPPLVRSDKYFVSFS